MGKSRTIYLKEKKKRFNVRFPWHKSLHKEMEAQSGSETGVFFAGYDEEYTIDKRLVNFISLWVGGGVCLYRTQRRC